MADKQLGQLLYMLNLNEVPAPPELLDGRNGPLPSEGIRVALVYGVVEKEIASVMYRGGLAINFARNKVPAFPAAYPVLIRFIGPHGRKNHDISELIRRRVTEPLPRGWHYVEFEQARKSSPVCTFNVVHLDTGKIMFSWHKVVPAQERDKYIQTLQTFVSRSD